MKLIKYDAMLGAIDACYRVDEVATIRMQAAALEHYAKMAADTEAEDKARKIRLRAERKAGQLLSKAEKAKGAAQAGTNRGKTTRSTGTTASTLKNLGITKNQSSQWQRLGKMDKDQFEAAIGETTRKPSTKGILKETKPKITVSTEALWLWGRLRDFERDGLLDMSSKEVMSTMTDDMKDDTHTLAPKVAAWLKKIGELK